MTNRDISSNRRSEAPFGGDGKAAGGRKLDEVPIDSRSVRFPERPRVSIGRRFNTSFSGCSCQWTHGSAFGLQGSFRVA